MMGSSSIVLGKVTPPVVGGVAPKTTKDRGNFEHHLREKKRNLIEE